ncbi:MAG TPA: hypothetical protein VF895_03110 [Gaiellaceae bacterium]
MGGRSRARSFVLGGLVGASAVLAAARRRRRRPRGIPGGLAAFEEAPCYEEAVERERAATAAAGTRPDER